MKGLIYNFEGKEECLLGSCFFERETEALKHWRAKTREPDLQILDSPSGHLKSLSEV
ncbi:unnamed protein product, partial [Vitis vinifera]